MATPKIFFATSLITLLLAACVAPQATATPHSTSTRIPPTTAPSATAEITIPGLIRAGEFYIDTSDDMQEGFLDVVEFQANVDEYAETVEVVFRLRDLPEMVTRRQILNFVEYWWEVSVFYAAPTDPNATLDVGIFVDTSASDESAEMVEGIHTPVPGTPEQVAITKLWDDAFAYTSTGDSLAAPDVVADPDADTLTLTAHVPGITSAAVFNFSTFHFDGSLDRPDDYVPPVAEDEAAGELTVNAYPGPHHYEGDVLTFEVTGLDGSSDSVALSLDGGEPVVLTGEWLTHEMLLLPLAFETAGLSGAHELRLSFQDGSVEYVYPLNLLPANERPANETSATWLIEEIDCCKLHHLSGTAAARDIDFIAEHFNIAAEQILTLYGETIDTKLDVYIIDRMWGNGGFGGGGELVISYTDRYYGPTVSGDGMETLARHEITHAAGIGSEGVGDGTEINQEGLAVFIAGGHYKPEPLALRGAALDALGRYVPLGDFIGQHELDYLHGAAFFTYIHETYGLDAIWRLIAADIDPADGQLTSLADAVEATFEISLEQMDQDFQLWLASHDPGEQLDDLRLTIELQELRRTYQAEHSPPPYFIAGRADNAITVPDYLPLMLREAEEPFNIAVELIIAAGQRAIIDGDYASAQDIVDVLNDILATETFAHPLAQDYFDIVTLLANEGYEVASLTIEGDSASAKVFVQAPELIDVELDRSSGVWQINQ